MGLNLQCSHGELTRAGFVDIHHCPGLSFCFPPPLPPSLFLFPSFNSSNKPIFSSTHCCASWFNPLDDGVLGYQQHWMNTHFLSLDCSALQPMAFSSPLTPGFLCSGTHLQCDLGAFLPVHCMGAFLRWPQTISQSVYTHQIQHSFSPAGTPLPTTVPAILD